MTFKFNGENVDVLKTKRKKKAMIFTRQRVNILSIQRVLILQINKIKCLMEKQAKAMNKRLPEKILINI